MNNEEEDINLLIDIDALFDTRSPILYQLDSDLLGDLVKNGKYHDRIKDSFGYIPLSLFKPLYEDRNKAVLGFSLPTTFLRLLYEYVVRFFQKTIIYGDNIELTIYLNTYPYNLTPGEIDNLVQGIMLLTNNVDVKVVHMSNSEISAEWVVEHVNMVIKYNGLDWINTQVALGNIVDNPLVSTTLLTPALVEDDSISETDIDNREEFFKNIEKMMAPMIRLNFLPAGDFSFLR